MTSQPSRGPATGGPSDAGRRRGRRHSGPFIRTLWRDPQVPVSLVCVARPPGQPNRTIRSLSLCARSDSHAGGGLRSRFPCRGAAVATSACRPKQQSGLVAGLVPRPHESDAGFDDRERRPSTAVPPCEPRRRARAAWEPTPCSHGCRSRAGRRRARRFASPGRDRRDPARATCGPCVARRTPTGGARRRPRRAVTRCQGFCSGAVS